MSDEDRITREDLALKSNSGRCDVCGTPVDMESGDRLAVQDFEGHEEYVVEDHDLDEWDAAEAIADAMERVAETPEGRELAAVIRAGGKYRAHESCLDETNIDQLTGEVDRE